MFHLLPRITGGPASRPIASSTSRERSPRMASGENPHSQFDVTFDGNMSADTPDLAIPEQLSGPEDSVRVNAALAYGGPHKELEVIIAPPAWSGRWGLDRALFCRRSRGSDVVGGAAEEPSWSPMYRVPFIRG